MKAILVATDLSPRSDLALHCGYALAEASGARLVICSVVDDDLPGSLATKMAAEAKAGLDEVCKSISSYSAEVIVEVGEPVATVLARADRVKADLVVLGQHRERPIWDIFHGTTMERIVRATEIPVLLVRDPTENGYERVLCGVDLSPACAAAARKARQIAPKAEMAAFHAVHVPYQGLTRVPGGGPKALVPFVKDAETSLEAWWSEADLPEGLVKPMPVVGGLTASFGQEINRFKPDLIAIGAHGRAAFVPSLLGHFTESVIRNPPCDVIVVRR
ncbi:universal stress protein [Vannielia sp.]|uniref:universal stress protein n=1 Tax=Vannielia sp. TaxID=2813045 RepID=UPI002621C45E|nr:universal stress protein [Vannielia sp.]MDF1871230.1 universal stress protein [Vannielia sp.]